MPDHNQTREDGRQSLWEATMFRVRNYIPFLIPPGLTLLIWLVAWHDDLSAWSDVSRLIGLFLLGFALLAVSLVFAVALRADAPAAKRSEPTLRIPTEYRSGFAGRTKPPTKVRLHPRAAKVIAFRRHAMRPQARVTGQVTSIETIESLKRRLHDRAQKLWSRRAS
jgi:hypothetical protein